MLISAALIVKDEAARLERCLRSLDGVVDEIVVVDTGSTDASVAIARRCGARVFHFEWRSDFSAARNFALAQCGARYVLYIDADEWIGASRGLRTQLRRRGHAGFWVALRPRAGFSAYPEMRIFRNHPLVRFEGVMHETIWPGIEAFRAAFPFDAALGKSSLLLEHDGYEGDPARKHARDLPLLRSALRRDPTRLFCWVHLARILDVRGDRRGAERAWSRALGLSRRRSTPRAEDALVYADLVGRRPRLLGEARRRMPGIALFAWLEAQLRMKQRRWRDALALLEGLTARLEDALACDLRIFGEWSEAARGTCAFQLGDYAEAARRFASAARLAPDVAEYRVKAAVASARTGARSRAARSRRRSPGPPSAGARG